MHEAGEGFSHVHVMTVLFSVVLRFLVDQEQKSMRSAGIKFPPLNVYTGEELHTYIQYAELYTACRIGFLCCKY